MAEFHRKHQAVIVTDDVGKRANTSLAMKHSYFLESGTTAGLHMRNIIEMPRRWQQEIKITGNQPMRALLFGGKGSLQATGIFRVDRRGYWS